MPRLALLPRAAEGRSAAAFDDLSDENIGPPSGIPDALLPSTESEGGADSHEGISEHDAKTMIGVVSMLLVLTIAAMIGRFLSRCKIKHSLGADDYLAFGAWVLFAGQCVVVFKNANIALTPGMPDFVALGKTKLSSTLLYLFCITVARYSVLFLYKRIFGLRILWFKICWWFLLLLASVYGFVIVVTNLTPCLPHLVSKLWTDPSQCRQEKEEVGPGAGAAVNVVVDAALLLLPIKMVWSLQMSQRQKFAVSSVFALGFIGVIISILRAIAIAKPSNFPGGGIFLFVTMSTVEPAVMIICACLPVMRPLFAGLLKAIPGYASWRSRSHSYIHSKRSNFTDSSHPGSPWSNNTKKWVWAKVDTESDAEEMVSRPSATYSNKPSTHIAQSYNGPTHTRVHTAVRTDAKQEPPQKEANVFGMSALADSEADQQVSNLSKGEAKVPQNSRRGWD